MIDSRKEACDILGIGVFADEDEVKRAFKNLVKIYHPDANLVTDASKYNELVMAYEYLLANPVEVVKTASPKVLGAAGNSRPAANYASFQKKYEQSREKKARDFEEKIAAYNEKVKRQDEEYKRAMEAINSIRVAEYIRQMIDRRKNI